MTATYFIADLHFGHRNICKYRPFHTNKEHDEHIIEQWNRIVTPRDKVFVLGDACFDEESLEQAKRLNGSKHLVMGNHCVLTPKLWKVFSCVSGPIKYKEFWLSHMPIHPEELRGKKNIHGHMHDAVIDSPDYISVCCERVFYTPVNLQDIRKVMRGEETEVMR